MGDCVLLRGVCVMEIIQPDIRYPDNNSGEIAVLQELKVDASEKQQMNKHMSMQYEILSI